MTNPHDPKESPVNEWETTDNAWVAHYPSVTGVYPLTVEHILDIVERDQLRDMVGEFRYVVRRFLEIIKDNNLEAVFGDLDWAKELLARE